MKKIKHIIIATDFSQSAELALVRALQLAKTYRAKLTIVHSAKESFADKVIESLIPKDIVQTADEYAARHINARIKALSRHKLNLHYKVISGDKPAFNILKLAKKLKADLLVIGAHGRTSIRENFIGTTAELIIERCKMPVLVVKQQPSVKYHNILMPTDFSAASKKAVLAAQSFFEDSHTTLLHVGDHELGYLLTEEKQKSILRKNALSTLHKSIQAYLEKNMAKFIASLPKHTHIDACKIKLGYPGPEIVREAGKTKQNIIVMGSQGHHRTREQIIGSTAKWVVNESKIDILFIPPY